MYFEMKQTTVGKINKNGENSYIQPKRTRTSGARNVIREFPITINKLQNTISYIRVVFFIMPCYNINVKKHTTIQMRLVCTISRVDIIMLLLVDL